MGRYNTESEPETDPTGRYVVGGAGGGASFSGGYSDFNVTICFYVCITGGILTDAFGEDSFYLGGGAGLPGGSISETIGLVGSPSENWSTQISLVHPSRVDLILRNV